MYVCCCCGIINLECGGFVIRAHTHRPEESGLRARVISLLETSLNVTLHVHMCVRAGIICGDDDDNDDVLGVQCVCGSGAVLW